VFSVPWHSGQVTVPFPLQVLQYLGKFPLQSGHGIVPVFWHLEHIGQYVIIKSGFNQADQYKCSEPDSGRE